MNRSYQDHWTSTAFNTGGFIIFTVTWLPSSLFTNTELVWRRFSSPRRAGRKPWQQSRGSSNCLYLCIRKHKKSSRSEIHSTIKKSSSG